MKLFRILCMLFSFTLLTATVAPVDAFAKGKGKKTKKAFKKLLTSVFQKYTMCSIVMFLCAIIIRINLMYILDLIGIILDYYQVFSN